MSRLALYARGLSGMGGVKQYIEAMCRALIRAIPETDELHILHNLDAPLFEGLRPNVYEALLKSKKNLICDFIEGPRALRTTAPDAVWYPKYVIPFGVPGRSVCTVHDMAYYLPRLGAYTIGDTLYMRTMIRNSLRRADAVVSVSEHTRRDILHLLPVTPEKVHVIHEAADDRYRPLAKADVDAFRQRYGLPERFILFTGGLSPRKNLIRLFDAYTAIARELDLKLVLTGGKGWRNKEVLSRLSGREDIIRLGFVPDEEMPLLYNAAALFVYPSLYEGFGLPVIEAGKCGTPVVCARGSSLTEVGGDGVLFVDGTRTDDIADGMRRVLTDAALRDDLVRRGAINAERFSWDAAAEALLRLLKNAPTAP